MKPHYSKRLERIYWSTLTPAAGTTLTISAGERGICGISFQPDLSGPGDTRDDTHPLIRRAAEQLHLYYRGELRVFDLPLDLEGTPFQLRVWAALQAIPYGKTISYADLANTVGSPRGFRAVGAANGKNPIPIVVPCHRVVESGGGLGGFSCGIEYKKRLLALEGQGVLW